MFEQTTVPRVGPGPKATPPFNRSAPSYAEHPGRQLDHTSGGQAVSPVKTAVGTVTETYQGVQAWIHSGMYIARDMRKLQEHSRRN